MTDIQFIRPKPRFLALLEELERDSEAPPISTGEQCTCVRCQTCVPSQCGRMYERIQESSVHAPIHAEKAERIWSGGLGVGWLRLRLCI